MNEPNVTKPYQRRRRFSRELKAEIAAKFQETGASVSRISSDNGLNANTVRRWVKEARRVDKTRSKTPAFVPVNQPMVATAMSNQSVSDTRSTIRIEIPRACGAVLVEWPAEQAHQCAALFRDLLG